MSVGNCVEKGSPNVLWRVASSSFPVDSEPSLKSNVCTGTLWGGLHAAILHTSILHSAQVRIPDWYFYKCKD
jgi:hypothetical protein